MSPLDGAQGVPMTLSHEPTLRRRDWLRWATALAAGSPLAARAGRQAPRGWVDPRLPLPAHELTVSDGRALALPSLVQGRVAAVQLMFTGCSSTCPPQGVLFAGLARALAGTPVQLLSISIDALGDTPQRLAAWQAQFGRHAGWLTAVPKVADVDRLADFFKGLPGRSGTHTSQVFVVDRHARLAWRSGDLPPVGDMAALLRQLAGAR